LHIGYVLQLCDDWARFHNYFVVNDCNKFRVFERDTIKLVHEEEVSNSLDFKLSHFNIFLGYEWILRKIRKEERL